MAVLAGYFCLCDYLAKNKLLYPKQFGFQTRDSTEHAIVQFVNQLLESFGRNKYTLDVFIDLSKAVDTLNTSSKLELNGATVRNRSRFKNYLSNK